MPRYKLHLSGGHITHIYAPSPKLAEQAYYGSARHFRTEYSVHKVEKAEEPTRRVIRKKRSGLPFGGPTNKMWKPTMRW